MFVHRKQLQYDPPQQAGRPVCDEAPAGDWRQQTTHWLLAKWLLTSFPLIEKWTILSARQRSVQQNLAVPQSDRRLLLPLLDGI